LIIVTIFWSQNEGSLINYGNTRYFEFLKFNNGIIATAGIIVFSAITKSPVTNQKNIAMKNLLLILPLSLMMTAMSAQDMKTNKKEAKQKSDVKETTSTTLDGKAFKVTLTSRTMDATMNGGSSGNISGNSNYKTPTMSGPADVAGGTTTGTANSGNTGINSGSTGASTTGASGTNSANNSGTMGSKTTTGLNTSSASGGSVAPGASTTSPSGVATNDPGTGAPMNSSVDNTAGTVTTQDPTVSGTQGQTMPADNTSTSQSNPSKDNGNGFTTNKRMIIRFENGMLHSSALASKGAENCPYHITSNDGNIMSFTSNCTSSVTKVDGVWSGIVDGNTIRGSFTWTTDDGRNIYYNFSGGIASQKDIDAAQELGLK
jgi:hypothetical protein